MSVKIIVDSSADLADDICERVCVVPLTVCFGETSYLDGLQLSRHEFYEKLIESDVLPTTSQANPAAFADVFERVTSEGDSAVVITIASTLSGTYQSACIAADDYTGISVVDSHSTTVGAGILAELALRLADSGMSAESIAERLEKERDNVHVIALLDTLEYLKRGGRISATVAFAGGLLNIKPVISLRGGEIKILGKARGSRQANNLLVSEIENAGGVDFSKPVLLGYTGLSDVLLKKYIADSEALWKDGAESLNSTVVGSVVGVHAGPGAIAVAFFRKG